VAFYCFKIKILVSREEAGEEVLARGVGDHKTLGRINFFFCAQHWNVARKTYFVIFRRLWKTPRQGQKYLSTQATIWEIKRRSLSGQRRGVLINTSAIIIFSALSCQSRRSL